MSLEIKIPVVGESITEVTISKWYKKSGDTVKMDEIICELESDKATFELNAEANGVLQITSPEGSTIAVGTIIGKIGGNGDAKPADAPVAKVEVAAPAPIPAPAPVKIEVSIPEVSKPEVVATPTISASTGEIIEMKVPTVGESISEVTIASWNKKEGDLVSQDEIICEIESDKATFELTAETNGYLHIIAEKGTTLAIGAPICTIKKTAGGTVTPSSTETPKVAVVDKTSMTTNYASGTASPAAAKILAEKEISANQVSGTGVEGRITKEDALNATTASVAPVVQASAPKPQETKTPAMPINTDARGQRREKMTSLRKTISKRLVAVKNETAMLTTFNEVDMKLIMDIRAKYKDSFKEKYGIGLGFMSFFTKACCLALQEFPSVNAQISGEEIIFNDYCDISVAVSAPKGLVVPVLRNAEKMTFNQVEQEIANLAKKARENKLSIEEMTGGTFTITNGGVFGSMLSTPIINAPQSAILGMHNIVERPVAVNGAVVIKPIMYVALSYDHRIIDGRESVGFLVRLKQLLEDPSRLLLQI